MKGFVKFIIGFVIFIVIALVGLLVTAIILINMTPNKLKCGDKVIINGKSFNDLGIGDVKIKTMISDCSEMKDKKNVVTNPFDSNTAKAEVMPMMEKLGFVSDSEIDFEALFSSYSTLSDSYYIELSDKTVAYLLNESIKYFISESDELANNKIELSEVSFYGTKKEIRVAYKVGIEEFKEKLESNIPSFISRFINMPKEIYLVCYYDVEVIDGKFDLTNEKIFINDVDTPFSNAILKAFSTEENDLSNNGFAEAIEEAMKFLGKIGSADTDTTGKVISGSEHFDNSGYMNGKIGLIYGA